MEKKFEKQEDGIMKELHVRMLRKKINNKKEVK